MKSMNKDNPDHIANKMFAIAANTAAPIFAATPKKAPPPGRLPKHYPPPPLFLTQ